MVSYSTPLIFSTRSYEYLASRLAQLARLERGAVERKNFKDGEHYLRVLNPIQGRNVIVVSGTIDDEETLELFDLANVLVDDGAFRLDVVLPYFGYSTMERAIKRGEAVKAKYRARLLSAIPRAAIANRFYLLDLHSEGIPHYFEGGVQTHHVYARDVIAQAARRIAEDLGGGEFVLACTDAGRSKWVESLARYMGVPPAFAYKRRIGESTVTLGVSGPIEGALVIIYDDMIRSGSSLMQAGTAYRDAGARALAAISTHGVLPGDALLDIEESGLFEKLVVTDSHPRAFELAGNNLTVESVADLFLHALRCQEYIPA